MPRKGCELLVFILVVLGTAGRSLSLTASFYGDSYIRVPLEDASSDTDIKLQFRTYRAQGLLLMAAGKTDYCILELQLGMVRVRLDLGSGEATLTSPLGVRFDDMRWHHLHLVRSGATVQLSIDHGIYATSTTTPGKFHELNINHGIFLGGIGTFSEIFYGNFKSFRGCLKHVLFNSVDIFHMARRDAEPQNTYEITWDCSAEFGATSDKAISLIHNTSFIAFPHLHNRQGGRVSFEIRTRTTKGLVLYNAGRTSKPDYFALELIDGKLKVSINKGSGTITLMSDTAINDGKWHQVEFVIGLSTMRITQDGVRKESRTHIGKNHFLDLHGHLFVGGIGLKQRGHAIQKGLMSLMGPSATAGSMIGCLRKIKVNGKLMGLMEAQISRGLLPECVFTYPCLEDRCVEKAKCVEQGFTSFECVCDSANCLKPTGSTASGPSIPINELIVLSNILVDEGGRRVLTTKNIDIILDFAANRIPETAVQFKIVTQPKYGQLQVKIAGRISQNSFTWADLKNGRVTYVHSGKQAETDSIGILLEFTGTPSSLPDKLEKMYGFALTVQVKLKNDKPVVELPADETLVLVENTEVKINPRIMDVIDEDDQPSFLEYTITYQEGYDIGYFELRETLGVWARVTIFTQKDILDGKVTYVHRGRLRQQIRIEASDGKESSDPVTLKIHAVALKLSLKANSGIILSPGDTVLILRDSLTFTTNAPNQDIETRYEITDPPYYGSVQRQKYEDNMWTTTTTFTQRHIDKSRLRYVHLDSKHPRHDRFKFKVMAMKTETREYEFNIKIMKVDVKLSTNEVLVVSGVNEAKVTSMYLRATSSIPTHKSKHVVFTIVTPPRKGQLFKVKEHRGRVSKHRLSHSSNFTQQDVNAEKIIYRVDKNVYITTRDSFQFFISAPGYISDPYTFEIKYEPQEMDTIVINKGLEGVQEGGKKVITKDDLYMESIEIKRYRFTIIRMPEYGTLQLINTETGHIRKNITTFITKDIRNGHLHYQHDDSESKEDSFEFMTTPIIQQPGDMVDEISEFTGTFKITINLKDDNEPVRVVDKVFNVVSNRGRIITSSDLRYMDPDINFNSSLLEYTMTKISNGEIVRGDNHSVPVYKFLQRDLDEGTLYFKHKGAKYDTFPFWVTDGFHPTAGKFEVKASDPYVKIVNNTGIAVQKGKSIVIMTSNLSVETNLNVDDKTVRFILSAVPNYGRLVINKRQIFEFTLADIQNGNLIYEHGGKSDKQDGFEFSVRVAPDVTTAGTLNIKILQGTEQQKPRIVHNPIIPVEQGMTVTITKMFLKVAHPTSQPDEIVYTVTKQPRSGILLLKGKPPSELVVKFTQADINARNLKYQNQRVFEELTDQFNFHVSNGMQSLLNNECVFDIIPETIPLKVVPFAVREGGKKSLTKQIVKVQNKHYQKEQLNFFIVKSPMNGKIEISDSPGMSVTQFTSEQLNKESIFYVHNGNDTISDHMILLARQIKSHKKSKPQTLRIKIIPVNDQKPKLVTNKRFSVWTKSVSKIMRHYLHTVDLDSRPTDIVYEILKQPNNGHIAFTNDTQTAISNFTQANINRGHVVFVHTGSAMRSDFPFRVSDGQFTQPNERFVLLARTLVLKMNLNKVLKVYPGTIQPITVRHLSAYTNDKNQSRPIVYTLQSKPQNGLLITLVNNSMAEVTSFSQDELLDDVIAYMHTTSMSSWNSADSFQFDVSTQYAESITFQTFRIEISFDNINNENKNQLIHMSKLTVPEGGMVTITRDELDVSMLTKRLIESGLPDITVKFLVTELPMHGWLSIGGENATSNSTFAQEDINMDKLKYQHDHSDSLHDAIHFELEISKTAPNKGDKKTGLLTVGNPRKLKSSFNITIRPVNDQRFKVLTEHPRIEVVQGFSVNITSANLKTIDPDSPPSEIQYKVVVQPPNGYIVRTSHPDRAIKSFTQEDIDKGQIMFHHDGSIKSGAFYFQVSDGHFKPYFKIFEIRIHPLTLQMDTLKTLYILQGYPSAYITEKTLAVKTNGKNLGLVMYNVTDPPKYGELYLTNEPTSQFTQRDLDQEQVVYIQTDFTSATDRFSFVVSDTQNRLEDLECNISVVARLKQQKPFAVPAGQAAVLSLDALDASELASSTNSNPVYVLTQHPKKGRLVKTMGKRSKRDADKSRKERPNKPKDGKLGNFTHQDIVDQVIEYKAEPTKGKGSQEDSFSFVLQAKNAQPAPGSLKISVQPPLKPTTSLAKTRKPKKTTVATTTTSTSTTPKAIVQPKPTAPKVNAGPKNTSRKKKIGKDHMTVIILVVGITLIVIVVFILVKCIKRRRRKLRHQQAMREDSRTPLAQPHVLIQPKIPMDNNREDDNRSTLNNNQDGVNIPVISISEPGSMRNDPHDYMRSRSLPRPRPVPIPTAPASPMIDRSHPVVTGKPPPAPRVQMRSHSVPRSPPSSPGLHRSELSRTVPSCTVTPLGDEETDVKKPVPPLKSEVTFDWETVDPELLQHCRTTNPVLHKNKYWV